MRTGKKPKDFKPTRDEIRAFNHFWEVAQDNAKHTMNRKDRREVIRNVKKCKR